MAEQKNKDMSIYVGIDVSKDSLQAAMVTESAQGLKVIATHKFPNTDKGFGDMCHWGRSKSKGAEWLVVMEATGIYHENVADYLYELGIKVSVELPNKIKHFAKSLNTKTKTDKIDALVIARYGLERNPSLWEPMTGNLAQMRALSRMIHSVKKDAARYKNRVSALKATGRTSRGTMEHAESLITQLERSIGDMERDLLSMANEDASLMERVRKVATIKGVKELTIIHLLCETNGFKLMGNARQAVSYAGLDVEGYESGTISRKGRISKKGNPRVRQLLYTPALVATRFGPESVRRLYERVAEKNPTAKKKAIVAAERKLLVLIYTLWKKNAKYDPDYECKIINNCNLQ